jgi:hypothetical protein
MRPNFKLSPERMRLSFKLESDYPVNSDAVGQFPNFYLFYLPKNLSIKQGPFT